MMQGVLWAFVQLSFLLGQVYSFDDPKKNATHSSTNVNGTEGKPKTITTHIPTDETPKNGRCQWLHNGNTIEENGRFTYSEDRSTGKYSLEIASTQRNDEGTYKYVCDDATESAEIFLKVIGIPAEEYPDIELNKVSNNIIAIRCAVEKCFPSPVLMFHDEKHVSYDNTTHFLINMTVPITSLNPNVTYICVLELEGYYKRFKPINGSQIIQYWNKTANESKVKNTKDHESKVNTTTDESTVKTTALKIPVRRKEGSPTNDWLLLTFKIAGGILFGTLAFASAYLVITYLRKSLNNDTSDIPNSLEMGKLMKKHEGEVGGDSMIKCGEVSSEKWER